MQLKKIDLKARSNLLPRKRDDILAINPLKAFALRVKSGSNKDSEAVKLTPMQIKTELLSGLTVALALVPEAVAFAFVAGVHPLVGLYAAFLVGLITAVFGGRPGMISGATGAMAVVMVHLIQKGNEVGLAMDTPIDNLGLQWLFITLLFVGGIQILAGVFKLGKFVRLIPHPVMMGFVNGLAIVIFLAQLKLFPNAVPKDISIWTNTSEWFSALFNNAVFWKMMGFIGLTMGIMYGLPKLTKKGGRFYLHKKNLLCGLFM